MSQLKMLQMQHNTLLYTNI